MLIYKRKYRRGYYILKINRVIKGSLRLDQDTIDSIIYLLNSDKVRL